MSTPTVRAHSLEEWRSWLAEHGSTAQRVELIVYRKGRPDPSVRFGDAIEHALCFGWVDSTATRRDYGSCLLVFTPRRPASTWGPKNRERAERLTAAGFMTPAGQRVIDDAKARGTWDALADAQALVVPDDLGAGLLACPAAASTFERFPPSSKRLILQWIATAKRPDTRRRRIQETVDLAEQGHRAHHPRPTTRA